MLNLIGKFFLHRLFKVVLALFAFLVCIEVCARVDDYVRYGASPIMSYSAEKLRSSKNGIPFNVPHSRFEKWQNNSFGFRGPEISLSKPAKKIRVVCLGASESYGLYESPGKEWPNQLKKMLVQSNYEVVNASVVGLNLRTYGQYFSSYVSPLNPDLVVMVINPLFYFTSLERTSVDAMSKPSVKIEKTKQTPSLANVLVKNTRCLSKVKQVLKQAAMTSFPATLNQYQIWSVKKQISQIESQRLKGEKTKDSVPQEYLVKFHDELTAIVTSLHSQGIKVLLSTYPSLMSRENLEKYPEIFLDNRRFCIELSLFGMINVFEKFNAVIASVAVEQRVLLVDSQRLIPKTTEYFGDNVHFKDSGARVFAEGVAEQLEKWPNVTGSAKDSKVEPSMQVRVK